MKITCVVDDVAAAQAAVKGGCTSLIVCQALTLPGAGLTPSIGTVESITHTTSTPTYVLIRPQTGGFVTHPHTRDVMERDIKHFATIPHVAGFIVAAQTHSKEVDVAFLTHLVSVAAPKEVWYSRAYMCLKDDFESFKDMKQAGLSGVVISLHGEIVEEKVIYAETRLEALKQIGLRGMIAGSIDTVYRHKVTRGLEHLQEVLHSWVLTIPVVNDFEGALLPWRDWDIGSYLWPDTKTERIACDKVAGCVGEYVGCVDV
eukprot:Blabericola_migrator_1__4024@NODE_2223_length_3098_cov_214_446057_g1400_i0_p2_GENE_NODE_2223_length_3098_cov_214_446057_g1400_i0NODE_2223_length_3098_cov_214_446057_g1400_i0_p2_ORF_typecomplete_len259_score57_34CutC/PF03932_14/2_2e27DHHA2/PF02833_14/0_19UFD1/PF03152_14/0_2_NODE_2223_length_3098_cov_214_446057_g1400_i0128904